MEPALQPASRRPAALFAEDFDTPVRAAQAAPMPPTYGAVELAAARTQAWADGYAAAHAAATAEHAAALARTARSIAEQVAALRAEAACHADTHAEAVARLWLDTLASLYPALCVRHGAAEAAALAKLVLPGLIAEPVVTIRADPVLAGHLAGQMPLLARHEPDRIRIVVDELLLPGDIRISWNNGSVSRDAMTLWEQVAAVLADAGLSCGELATEMQDAA